MKTIILGTLAPFYKIPTNSVGRQPSAARTGFVLVPLLIICLSTLPKVQAVNPPPDGGYVGGNTAEGQNALLSLTTGAYNTAVGLFSLESNTEGQFNTAVGAGALLANVGDPSTNHGIENTATGAGGAAR
jgi:hypothetical protein